MIEAKFERHCYYEISNTEIATLPVLIRGKTNISKY